LGATDIATVGSGVSVGGVKSCGPIAQMRLERTPDKREVGSSTLPRPTTDTYRGGVAQLGERLPCTQEAIGSIPFTSIEAVFSYQFLVFSFTKD
jgi:hypothetical protein